jgi:hypothetical protein
MKTKLLALALLFLPACATLTKPCVEACQPGSVCVAGVCVAVTTPPPVEPPAPPVQPPVQPPPAPPVQPPPVVPPVVPPPPSVFPVRFPLAGTIIYMRNSRYGNGMDSTPRANGDPALGFALHHVPTNDFHFDSDVWTSKDQRGEYEMLVLAGARDGQPLPAKPLGPVWQYKAGGQQGRCHDDQSHANTSCDHFGSAYVDGRDDPQTKTTGDTLTTLQGFEGRPLALGLQRDEFGPYAGFFMVPQTSGANFGTLVRACLPLAEGNDATCAPWVAVDWK